MFLTVVLVVLGQRLDAAEWSDLQRREAAAERAAAALEELARPAGKAIDKPAGKVASKEETVWRDLERRQRAADEAAARAERTVRTYWAWGVALGVAVWAGSIALGYQLGAQKEAAWYGALCGALFGPLGTITAGLLDGRPACFRCRQRVGSGAEVCPWCHTPRGKAASPGWPRSG